MHGIKLNVALLTPNRLVVHFSILTFIPSVSPYCENEKGDFYNLTCYSYSPKITDAFYGSATIELWYILLSSELIRKYSVVMFCGPLELIYTIKGIFQNWSSMNLLQ